MSNRYDLIGYCSYRDNETGKVSDNFVGVLNEQDQKIKDLESQLAESEKTEDGEFWFEMWQHKKRDYDSVYKAYIENCAEVDQLEQQLSKKVEFGKFKSAEELLKAYQNLEREFTKSRQKLAEKEKEIEGLKKEIRDELVDNNMSILELQQSQNQTAIAKLEKVKEFCNNPLIQNVYGNIPEFRVVNYIDQQINELKGEE